MLTPTKKTKVRKAITSWGLALIANANRVHYTQARRFPYYDNPSAANIELDCSGTVGNEFWNAMHDTGIYLADPLGFRYTGVGNTTSLEAWLRQHGKPVTETNGYLVGDIARYGQGEHAHTTVCVKAGSAKTSQWLSNGSEGGPYNLSLGYRDDLVGCWRHPALV